MKIIIKCLNGQTFNLDVNEADTVLNIKEKIHKIKQAEPSQQKLLRKGVLLDNNSTVQEVGMQENDIIVLMTTVKKTQPPPQQQPIPAQVQQPPLQQIQPQPPIQPIQQPKTTATYVPQNASQKSDYDETIQNLMSMGFTKAECEAAMKAAFNNQDRAVDYLLNGIPQTAINNTAPQVGHPQDSFQQFSQLLQQNTGNLQEQLPQLLAQLYQQNPGLDQQIAQNPENLLQLLAELGQNEEDDDGLDIQVTDEEEKQINQLILMGFSKDDALEAFLTCDKNVEAAASYLFEKQAKGDLLSQHIQREVNDHPEQEGGDEHHFDDEDDDDDYEY